LERERERVRGTRTHGINDGLQDTLDVLNHFVIPKAQRQMAARLKDGGFRVLPRTDARLTSVHLDDQTRRFAAEVDDVAANGNLTAKFSA
jgi:hypothetical protein